MQRVEIRKKKVNQTFTQVRVIEAKPLYCMFEKLQSL
jgi:hypothetical protein